MLNKVTTKQFYLTTTTCARAVALLNGTHKKGTCALVIYKPFIVDRALVHSSLTNPSVVRAPFCNMHKPGVGAALSPVPLPAASTATTRAVGAGEWLRVGEWVGETQICQARAAITEVAQSNKTKCTSS
eukprot:778713-Pelagomonas_calceolata.AAC.4